MRNSRRFQLWARLYGEEQPLRIEHGTRAPIADVEGRAEQGRQSRQRRVEQSRAERSRAEQSRAEQSRVEQSRAEQSRAEQADAASHRAEQKHAGDHLFLATRSENGNSDRYLATFASEHPDYCVRKSAHGHCQSGYSML